MSYEKINPNKLVETPYTWDQYFMTMAYLVSMKSKDPSTKVGAVIVGEDNEIRSTGYNGLPRKVEDKLERYDNREVKLLISNHAEENAILNCLLFGISVKNCSIYVPWMPCSMCAKSIIQVGIKEVICDLNFPGNNPENQHDWLKSMNLSKEMLRESGVTLRHFNSKLIQIYGKFKGEIFDLYHENM